MRLPLGLSSWMLMSGLWTLLAIPGAHAEAEPSAAEEMLVTATQSPRTASLVPASTSVISGAEIEALHAESLNDVLRYVSGLHLEQQGGRGGHASLYLRGLDPNHVVVMIDGIRLNDPTNSRGGSFDPSTLEALDIDRIEVVRGPLSAVYGSDAIAGAINIITRRVAPDADPSFALTAVGGRFDTGQVSGRASGGIAGVAGVSVAGSYTTNSYETDFEPPSPSGDYSGTNWKATVDAVLPGAVDLRADLRFADAKATSFPDFSGGPELAVLRELEERDIQELSTGLRLGHQTTDWLELAFRGSFVHRTEDLESPGVAPASGFPGTAVPPTSADDHIDRTQLTAFAVMTPLHGLSLTAGTDVQWEHGVSDAFFDFGFPVPASFELTRRIVGLFFEGLYAFDWGLSLSASVRGDFPSDHDTVWTPAVGGTLEIPKTPLVLFGTWSKGFKLPSFYALGNPLVGNSNLDAEKSRGWELGLRGSFWNDRIRSRLAYFDLDVVNLIDFDPGSFQLVNLDQVLSSGVEFELEASLTERIDAGGSVTFNPTDIVGSPTDLRNRPRWRGDLHLTARPIDQLEVGLRVLFVGDVSDSSNPTGLGQVTLDGYQRVDFNIAWHAHPHATFFVAIDNLFDASYEEAVGFPALGIYPRVGAELHF